MNIRVRHLRQGKLEQCDRCHHPARVYPVPATKWDANVTRSAARWCERCIAVVSTSSDPFYTVELSGAEKVEVTR
jgi:hypothetical protein